MSWWSTIVGKILLHGELWTPGTGVDGGDKRRPFYIDGINATEIVILSEEAAIKLERDCFDVIEAGFRANPDLSLRIASKVSMTPFPDSADALIREATGSQLALGNYVCGAGQVRSKGKT